MLLPSEYVFNKTYSTETIIKQMESIGLYVKQLEGSSENFDLIGDLCEQADLMEDELQERSSFPQSQIIGDFKVPYLEKVNPSDINMQNMNAGL